VSLVISRRLALAGLVLAGPLSQVAVAQEGEDARFTAFLDAAFDEAIALSPEAMTSLGIKKAYDRLDDYTPAGADRALALSEDQLKRMKAQFAYDRLSHQSQISWRLFERSVERAREGAAWRDHDYIATTNGSPAGEIPVFLINQHRVDSVEDAQAYVSRLKETRRVMVESAEAIERAAAKGIVAPAFTFAPVDADARNVLDGAPFTEGKDSAVWADFKAKVGKLSADQAQKDQLLKDGQAALTGPFKAGYDRFLATQKKVQAQAKGNNGAWSLPNGEAYYAFRLKGSTTTDMTAEAIHQLGLKNLARIQTEMRAIMAKVGFKGTLQEFFKAVKTDPARQYPNTEAGRQQYLADARTYIAQAMEKAPQYFLRLPKAPLEVRAVEEWRQETASVAFYNRPTPDGSRPGIFYVNLADMNQVLKPQVDAIAYHEGAPGHHFQGALSQELPNVPKFRRFGGNSAYGEGWGLYAERLAQEMGFYREPMSEFGMLSTSLWRAIRLVVDTGIHAKGWTRDQTIQYILDNSSRGRSNATAETERYIAIPGQALAYKIGQMKISELRAKAEKALGPRFDIREFHAQVLMTGALPLAVLEAKIDRWIAGKKAS
jgi:uncharacterized protein (DUF885 family)